MQNKPQSLNSFGNFATTDELTLKKDGLGLLEIKILFLSP